MRYADVIWNDITAGNGLCVSFYTQGCPHHCPGCQNPGTWDFEGGKEFPSTLLDELPQRLNAQGINRPLCILGGEPLCQENLFLTHLLIKTVKEKSPRTKIYLWTGYLYEDLKKQDNRHVQYILQNINTLIDGPFIQEERDITLKMRGSRNQRIIDIQ
jgi:anaerobic ribonucleoside-triphosphate reductase activating protein